jgi:hypothetical protein
MSLSANSGPTTDIAPHPLCADFVAEVSDVESVMAGANFLS